MNRRRNQLSQKRQYLWAKNLLSSWLFGLVLASTGHTQSISIEGLIKPQQHQRAETQQHVLKVAVHKSKALWQAATATQACYEYQPPVQHNLTRGFLEVMILCRALHTAGAEFKIEIVDTPSHARAIRMVESGAADILGETTWLRNANPNEVLISSAVIRLGKLEKGLYTKAEHPAQQQVQDAQSVQGLRGITVDFWKTDRKALEDITPLSYSAAAFDNLHNMLVAGRADFTLFKFPQSQDLSIDIHGQRYLPLKGVKVQLMGTRHFLIDKQHLQAELILQAINQGLEQLHQTMDVEDFIGSAPLWVRDWQVLNNAFTESSK
ncbi:hypothetical protein [Agaribacterium sp. ZY112]|uniref:hypothetical protein n=1 Tax=Agaribacterium sp. ZY112 TaxID=3233574 RepID=UPI0035259D7A